MVIRKGCSSLVVSRVAGGLHRGRVTRACMAIVWWYTAAFYSFNRVKERTGSRVAGAGRMDSCACEAAEKTVDSEDVKFETVEVL